MQFLLSFYSICFSLTLLFVCFTGRPQSGGAAELEQIASAGAPHPQGSTHVMETSPPLQGGEGEGAPTPNRVDVFGATPFGQAGGNQGAQPSQAQAQQRNMSPREAELLGATPAEPQPESASTPRIAVGFDDDFLREGKQEEQPRTERLTSAGSELDRSIRELDEFGAKPFGVVRTHHEGSESSSDHEGERLSSSLREFSYDTFDSDSLDIRKDEEHAHRGLLDQEESSDDESDEDSDHQDFDEIGAQPLMGDEGHGLSDAELASLNLREDLPKKAQRSEPPVAQLIDMTDDDPFSQAPFRAKTGSLKRATEPVGMNALTPPMSPPMQDEDPFGEAPFNPRTGLQREASKTSISSAGSDVFSKAPFPASKKRQGTESEVRQAKSQHVSGEQTALGNPTPPISPTELGSQGVSSKVAKEPDMFGAVPFSAVASGLSDKEDSKQPGRSQ